MAQSIGTPEMGPNPPRAPEPRTTTPLPHVKETVPGAFAPHEEDHGADIFNHPSTNRAPTGVLSGKPEGVPTPSGFGEPRNKLPVTPRNRTPNRRTTPITPPRRVDIPMPPNLSTGPENAPHRAPRHTESGSSRAVHQGRQDLARHNRSGS